MNYLLIYMLKSAVLLALLSGIYRLTLRRETFHGFNRVVLLGIMVVSLVLPAVTFSTSSPGVANMVVAEAEEWLAVAQVSADDVPARPETFDFRAMLPGLVSIIYAVGLVAMFLRQALQYAALVRLFRRSRRIDDIDGLRIYINDELAAPVSWMNRIVLSTADYRENAVGLFAHEAAHARGHHTCDLIVAEMVYCLQWFNPAMRFFMQDLRAVHEFLADRAAAAPGMAGEAYQLLLIKKAVAGKAGLAAAHCFNACPVKRRLTMMYAKPSHRSAALKVLLLAPAVLLALGAFAKPEIVEKAMNPSPEAGLKTGYTPHSPRTTGTGVSVYPVEAGTEVEIYLDGQRISEKEAAKYVDYSYNVEEKSKNFRLLADSPVKSIALVPGDKDKQIVVEMRTENAVPAKTASVEDSPHLKLLKELGKKLVYPEKAKKAKIEGRVICKFQTNEKGDVLNLKIVKSLSPECDQAVVDVVKRLSKETLVSLYQINKNAKDENPYIELPIVFRLQ